MMPHQPLCPVDPSGRAWRPPRHVPLREGFALLPFFYSRMDTVIMRIYDIAAQCGGTVALQRLYVLMPDQTHKSISANLARMKADGVMCQGDQKALWHLVKGAERPYNGTRNKPGEGVPRIRRLRAFHVEQAIVSVTNFLATLPVIRLE